MTNWIDEYINYEADYVDSQSHQAITEEVTRAYSRGSKAGRSTVEREYRRLLDSIWDVKKGDFTRFSKQHLEYLYEDMLRRFLHHATEEFNNKIRPSLRAEHGGMGDGVVLGLHTPKIEITHAHLKKQDVFTVLDSEAIRLYRSD